MGKAPAPEVDRGLFFLLLFSFVKKKIRKLFSLFRKTFSAPPQRNVFVCRLFLVRFYLTGSRGLGPTQWIEQPDDCPKTE